jgi:hypothetical protein
MEQNHKFSCWHQSSHDLDKERLALPPLDNNLVQENEGIPCDGSNDFSAWLLPTVDDIQHGRSFLVLPGSHLD